MNFLKTYSIHILLIIIIFCLYSGKKLNNNDFVTTRERSVGALYKTSYATANYDAIDESSSVNSRFVQNNYIEIESKDAKKSKDKIEQGVKTNNGIINSINSFYISNKIGYNILIKIPSSDTDSFIKNVIKSEGKVLNENFSITNVTKQYTNNENTIKNLSIRRDKLRELLKKSEKVDDVLKIDRELTNVQNQLDSYLTINKNIQDDVDLTTISITINPKIFLNNEWNINSSFYKAFKNLTMFSQKMVDVFVYLLLFLPYIIIVYVVCKIFKKKK